jgi:hypothetical protein
MQSERTWGPPEGGSTATAVCPACGESLAVDGQPVQLYEVVRCRLCERLLHVVVVEPLSLRVFCSQGLALVDD